ncbi:MAG: peptide chain release factor N(5)-glutamine methyltransferase [Deltaproteobacteria bacterium]|nr:peptide chain release factor N(5)-glutamine methyltransferase [Deltaproteobacteria bacterium]
MTNVKQHIDWATTELIAAGVPNPRVDAEWLLAHLLGKRRDHVWTNGAKALTDAERVAYEQLVARRVRREPLQYIMGSQEFYGRSFRVTPAVLIPRPETELLIDAALRCIPQALREGEPRFLDIGTGSGCMAITLALECPTAQIVAIDISTAALEVARDNAARHDVADQITFRHADCRDFRIDTPCDLVIANPPYCPVDQWAALQPEVRDHEPAEAVLAGVDGLDFLRAIVKNAPAWIAPGGWLCVEVGDAHGEFVWQCIDATGAYNAPALSKDYNGIERVVCARRQ